MEGRTVALPDLTLPEQDVAALYRKLFGETAKHLKRLFARAGEMNAVLLFDEADALFSRRTDTRDSVDRHANADTRYLLQLVEDYPVVALLATNKRQQSTTRSCGGSDTCSTCCAPNRPSGFRSGNR